MLKLNEEGKIALAHFTDCSIYNKVADAVGAKEMIEAASYMGPEFANWLLVKTEEENFDKEEVYSGLIKVNRWGKTALAQFADWRTWAKVASAVGAYIARPAVAMPLAFTEWVVQKTEEEGWEWGMGGPTWEWKEKQEEGWEKKNVYQLLCKATREHQTALSNPSLRAPMWTKLASWAPKQGIHILVENNDLNEALKTWHTTHAEEAAELVRTLIEKKGVLVKLLGNDNNLESAVNQWNEMNKQLSE